MMPVSCPMNWKISICLNDGLLQLRSVAKANKRPSWQVDFRFRRHRLKLTLDNILVFNLLNKLHGRFWLAAIVIMVCGFSLCFAIRPDMLRGSTAISQFGNDVRTAPYFAGTIFLSSYALWRWRNYLKRTLSRSRPVLALLMATIVGLYVVALMPLSWKPWPFYIHYAGMMLVL